jgi:septum formation protein
VAPATADASMPPMPPPLILASTSPYRRELLERLGVPFTCVPPACDEEALKRPELAPRALAELLARAKADSIAADRPDAVVIGSDQVCALDERVLGKPGSPEGARAQLAALSGREHRLITAVAVVHGPRALRHTEIAVLAMRPLSAGQIARYVDRDRPFDCAGSYKLERAGISLLERIECGDHTAITGLPLMTLARMLGEFGFEAP